jgi:hypothetical protein
MLFILTAHGRGLPARNASEAFVSGAAQDERMAQACMTRQVMKRSAKFGEKKRGAAAVSLNELTWPR